MLGLDNPAAVGTTAIAVPFLIQALKNSPLVPWMNRETERINLTVGLLASGLAAAGIHFAWDANLGNLAITVNSHMLWAWFVQWAGQQAAYKSLVVPSETLGEIRSILQAAFAQPKQQPPLKG